MVGATKKGEGGGFGAFDKASQEIKRFAEQPSRLLHGSAVGVKQKEVESGLEDNYVVRTECRLSFRPFQRQQQLQASERVAEEV